MFTITQTKSLIESNEWENHFPYKKMRLS